jgi:hypothetical protein
MIAALSLTQLLGGVWHGRYGLAFCPAHDNRRTPALSVSVGRTGRLLLKCFSGCQYIGILTALREKGLLDDPAGRRAPVVAFPAPDDAAATKPSDHGEIARQLWRRAQPIASTPAEAYLRRRAIKAPPPASLRFAPQCLHGQTQRRLPAMLGSVVINGRQVGLHRTYLDMRGRKAEVAPSKTMLGPCAGGHVPLSKGNGPLVVGEGIETSLSVLELMGKRSPRVWAALSTSGMRRLILPETVGVLVIAPDNDAAGLAAAEALARRARSLGWIVTFLPPPEGFKDWNDAAQEGAR